MTQLQEIGRDVGILLERTEGLPELHKRVATLEAVQTIWSANKGHLIAIGALLVAIATLVLVVVREPKPTPAMHQDQSSAAELVEATPG